MNNFTTEVCFLESCCDFLLLSFEGREGGNQLLSTEQLHLPLPFMSSAALCLFVTPNPSKPSRYQITVGLPFVSVCVCACLCAFHFSCTLI